MSNVPCEMNCAWKRARTSHAAAIVLVVLGGAAVASAAAPRVLPDNTLPDDARLGSPKTLNDHFPFQPPGSSDEWRARAERVRRQLRVALGLWPMPTKAPAQAVVHGKVDRDDYTVERVYLQSFPGHFVTGNLYRPRGQAGRRPAVLCPHGHWQNGRFYWVGDEEIQKQLDSGAERYETGGRSPLQSRCVQLARMGCVVFHYDMVGYADSVQLAHRPGYREHMCTPQDWGYFSPQAELHLQNMMGLQTYNSICALDWLSQLPDVDPQRIAVTGASGGGTQTFILCALDPRPKVAFPAVMVSTHMQGGCTCENACYLRIGTGNVEIAGLFAPKPLGMTAADDWTHEMATDGGPQLATLFRLLGAEDQVQVSPFLQFGHNYNYVSRAVMYPWMNTHLGLGLPEPIVEQDYVPLTREEMTVWDVNHPPPPSGDAYERELLRWITADGRRQMAAIEDRLEHGDADAFRTVVGGAVDVLIGRGLPEEGEVEFDEITKNDRGAYIEFGGLLRQPARGEELPTIFLHPSNWNGDVVIWTDPHGKQALFDSTGAPRDQVRRLLEACTTVVGIDLLLQGEFLRAGQGLDAARAESFRSENLGGYAGYVYGYNHPLFAQRVHDLLSVVSFVRHHERSPRRVMLFGSAGAGHWAAAARAQAGAAVDRAAIDTAGFRFAELARLNHPDFLPGGAKYGDLPGMLALSAPGATWVAGEGDALPEVVTAAYRAAGVDAEVTAYAGGNDTTAAAVTWLLGP